MIVWRSPVTVYLEFGGQMLRNANELEILGVIYDKWLTFHQHILKVSKRGAGKIASLRRISWLIEQKDKDTLYYIAHASGTPGQGSETCRTYCIRRTSQLLAASAASQRRRGYGSHVPYTGTKSGAPPGATAALPACSAAHQGGSENGARPRRAPLLHPSPSAPVHRRLCEEVERLHGNRGGPEDLVTARVQDCCE